MGDVEARLASRAGTAPVADAMERGVSPLVRRDLGLRRPGPSSAGALLGGTGAEPPAETQARAGGLGRVLPSRRPRFRHAVMPRTRHAGVGALRSACPRTRKGSAAAVCRLAQPFRASGRLRDARGGRRGVIRRSATLGAGEAFLHDQDLFREKLLPGLLPLAQPLLHRERLHHVDRTCVGADTIHERVFSECLIDEPKP